MSLQHVCLELPHKRRLVFALYPILGHEGKNTFLVLFYIVYSCLLKHNITILMARNPTMSGQHVFIMPWWRQKNANTLTIILDTV